MGLSAAARPVETARAFDAVAREYHRSNTENPILRAMRDRVIETFQSYVSPGSHVVDLGCGPGTDHGPFVRAGYTVTGIDLSPEMVREARVRAASAGQDERVSIEQLGIEDVAALGSGVFDAAFSNFGALNCVADLHRAAEGIHQVLRPGGVLVASVMGKLCPWEIALFVGRGDVSRAFFRWRTGMVAVPLLNGHVWTQYFTTRQFVGAFADVGFTCVAVRALGLCAPPPYLDAFAARHPTLLSALLAADDWIGGWPVLRAVGDHFLVVMRRD